MKPLLYGWQEMEPIGEPVDEGTPKDDWNNTANPRHPRKEIKLWVRGNRYVRICEVEVGEDKYHVHSGWLVEPVGDDIEDRWSTLKEAEACAIQLMQQGGV